MMIEVYQIKREFLGFFFLAHILRVPLEPLSSKIPRGSEHWTGCFHEASACDGDWKIHEGKVTVNPFLGSWVHPARFRANPFTWNARWSKKTWLDAVFVNQCVAFPRTEGMLGWLVPTVLGQPKIISFPPRWMRMVRVTCPLHSKPCKTSDIF
jgi:hypothetical protein